MKSYVVAIAIISKEGKYLLGKRSNSKEFSPNKWEFISGFVEDKEAAEDTIIREIKEEIGVKGKVTNAGKPIQVMSGDERWIMLPFAVEIEGEPKANPADHSELKWMRKEELESIEELKQEVFHLKMQKLL